MKSLLLIFLALEGTLGFADTWTDGKGLVAKSKLSKLNQGAKQLQLSLVGTVSVVSEPQGLTLNADRMNFNATPDPKQKKAYLINDATAVGSVVVIKTVSSKSGKKTTRIEGSKGDYSSGLVESVVKMAGPMKIQSTDESNQPTMIATGDSGVATLEPLKKTNLDNALRKATVDGNVHLTLMQADAKTKSKTTVHTTSDHMVLENIPTGKKVTLTGSVHITADGMGDISGAKRAIFALNKNGDIQLETTGAK